MKKYIIVGQGLAAFIVAHQLHKKNIEFTLIGDPKLSSSSLVAAGIWNPIVFKRLTKSWMADKLIPSLENFYSECERKLGTQLITKRKLIRPFSEKQEIDLWLKKAKNEMHEFLSQEIFSEDNNKFMNCPMPLGYGEVLQAGNLDIKTFIEKSQEYFKEKIIVELFDYKLLEVERENIYYKELKADGIIFCEGYLIRNNPYFNYIPMKPVKGEVLEIHCEDLNFKNALINKGGFLMDIGEKEFKAGATFNWDDLKEEPSAEGKKELELNLAQITSKKYSIIKHEAGIRPSVIDRRPVSGVHPKYKNLFVFNGLGTKGVMLAPYLADNFVHFVLNTAELNAEANVSRFDKLYPNT